MPELLIHTADGDLCFPFSGTPLLYDLFADLPDAPDRPCGGGGTCGRCAVIAQGALSVMPTPTGKVLSCQAHLLGDAEVWLPRRKVLTQIETRTLDNLYPVCSPFKGEYGAAIDLGTTTIVLELIRLSDGETLAVVSCENPQRMIAADVIGRIDSALKGKLPLLHSLVQDCVNSLEKEAFAHTNVPEKQADIRIIAGNSTMLYLYSGRSPITLASAPFEADCLFDLKNERDYLPACAGAFVGADITCAILSSGMCTKAETAMLIDIGTNGEIALWHEGKLYCCATAAGPAFEGSGISCGTGSIPGAIDSVHTKDGELVVSAIGGAAPCGICGSGLIDLVASLLETGQLDETGALDEDILLAEGVSFSQQDVRQVQLAKGAIAAGIQLLLKRANISCEDVHKLYIAGGFGSHLNLKNAAAIGLIPDALADKTAVLGNASLCGARQLLLTKEGQEQACQIAKSAQCLNLAADPSFGNVFVECMLFEGE